MTSMFLKEEKVLYKMVYPSGKIEAVCSYSIFDNMLYFERPVNKKRTPSD